MKYQGDQNCGGSNPVNDWKCKSFGVDYSVLDARVSDENKSYADIADDFGKA